MDCGVGEFNIFAVWGMLVRLGKVFKGYRKMHNVEVKLFYSLILQLLCADEGNSLFFVETIPEFRDSKQVRALYEPSLTA